MLVPDFGKQLPKTSTTEDSFPKTNHSRQNQDNQAAVSDGCYHQNTAAVAATKPQKDLAANNGQYKCKNVPTETTQSLLHSDLLSSIGVDISRTTH